MSCKPSCYNNPYIPQRVFEHIEDIPRYDNLSDTNTSTYIKQYRKSNDLLTLFIVLIVFSLLIFTRT